MLTFPGSMMLGVMTTTNKYLIPLLAMAATGAAVHAANGQRPADSSTVSQAGSLAQTVHRGRSRAAVAYTIDSTEIMASSAHTLSEVLQGRVPSLSVMQSGGVAAQGAQIRSRGTRSFYMASEPILIVDGIRVDATQDATVVAINVSSSRLDDIALEDIARIELLPGPAAAGTYGAGAAGGAIVITTKRGGEPGLHMSSRVQSGIGMVAASFPTNYQLQGVNAAGQTIDCPLFMAAAGQCTPTTLLKWNPLENASPFRTARNAGGAFAVDGTVRQTSARVGFTGNRTLGVTGDDDAGRFGARGSVTQRIGHSFEISGGGSYLQTSAGLPVRGELFEKSNVIANGLIGSAVQDSLNGYALALAATSTREHAHHWTGGATANWEAFGLLHVSGLYGRDNIAEADDRRGNRGNGSSVEQGGFDHSLTTIALSAQSADWTLFHPSLRARTLVSYDQLRSRVAARDSLGLVTYPTVYTASWVTGAVRIAGNSVRQELTWNDRLLFGAGVRWERWSHVSTHFFKNADLSWLVGRVLRVDSLRLRGAYGEANNWTPSAPQSVGTLGTSTTPNPMSLGPDERVKETELGADFAFTQRARFSLTAYRADASHLFAGAGPIVSPTSYGGYGYAFGIYYGSLRNWGLELASQLRLVQTDWLLWDASLRASTLRERATSVGPAGVSSIGVSPGGMSTTGGAVNGYYAIPYTYADANHDGLLSAAEVQQLNTERLPLGTSLPTREASVLSTWGLARGVSISALLDYHGGQKLANLNEAIRCIDMWNCRATNDRLASLADQAQALARGVSQLPYVEGASFAKLRELSVRWTIPSGVAAFGSVPASITIAGRNLVTWTRYRGIDPELNERPLATLPRAEFAETPLPRELLVRLDLGAGR